MPMLSKEKKLRSAIRVSGGAKVEANWRFEIPFSSAAV
jgi:hypothetical protein